MSSYSFPTRKKADWVLIGRVTRHVYIGTLSSEVPGSNPPPSLSRRKAEEKEDFHFSKLFSSLKIEGMYLGSVNGIT